MLAAVQDSWYYTQRPIFDEKKRLRPGLKPEPTSLMLRDRDALRYGSDEGPAASPSGLYAMRLLFPLRSARDFCQEICLVQLR